jgi:phospholipid/cholesterol/gamma-HCH transport system substrate-binding protein
MSKPFKFRYVNEITGVFVLLVLAALIAGIVLAGKAQGWFEPRYVFRVKFPAEGSAGIQKGAEVWILGTQVGAVDQITVSDDGSMEGVLEVRGAFIRFVRQDSVAVLKKKFGVAGDAFIEITKGVGPAFEGEAPYIPCRKDTELLELMLSLVDEIQKAVMPLIEQVRLAVEEYTMLGKDMRDPDGQVQQLLARVNAIMAGLQEGQGTAGKLLKDPETAEELEKAVITVNSLLAETDAVLSDIRKVTAELPEITIQTEQTLYESQRLLEGIQRHWLLRKYIKEDDYKYRISPSRIHGAERGTQP